MKSVVLFVDDEPSFTDSLKRILRKEPYEILSAGSADEALMILDGQVVDVVVSDEKMPGMSGSEFLSIVSKRYPETIRIMLTGHASLELAVKAINEGQIYRFLTKPCNGVDLSNTIRQALEFKELFTGSKRLLQVARHQASLLMRLESENPGITHVERDLDGAVILEELDTDFESLKRQIDDEIERYLSRLGE